MEGKVVGISAGDLMEELSLGNETSELGGLNKHSLLELFFITSGGRLVLEAEVGRIKSLPRVLNEGNGEKELVEDDCGVLIGVVGRLI